MIWWLLLAVYVIGYVRAVFAIVGAIERNDGTEDETDRLLTGVLAVLVATLWPLLLVGLFVAHAAHSGADRPR